ncbi:Octapeptide-repeat protein T2, partial [Ophiophagus hannah]
MVANLWHAEPFVRACEPQANLPHCAYAHLPADFWPRLEGSLCSLCRPKNRPASSLPEIQERLPSSLWKAEKGLKWASNQLGGTVQVTGPVVVGNCVRMHRGHGGARALPSGCWYMSTHMQAHTQFLAQELKKARGLKHKARGPEPGCNVVRSSLHGHPGKCKGPVCVALAWSTQCKKETCQQFGREVDIKLATPTQAPEVNPSPDVALSETEFDTPILGQPTDQGRSSGGGEEEERFGLSSEAATCHRQKEEWQSLGGRWSQESNQPGTLAFPQTVLKEGGREEMGMRRRKTRREGRRKKGRKKRRKEMGERGKGRREEMGMRRRGMGMRRRKERREGGIKEGRR